jgi:phosphoglycerate kinase
VRLPADVVVAEATNAEFGLEKRANALPQGTLVLDIGPETLAGFARGAERAKTVLWAGALGAVENPAFAAGTVGFARVLAASKASRVVLDGPLIAALLKSGEDLVPNLGFVSTGGRASLEYIEGRLLPGIEALRGGAT